MKIVRLLGTFAAICLGALMAERDAVALATVTLHSGADCRAPQLGLYVPGSPLVLSVCIVTTTERVCALSYSLIAPQATAPFVQIMRRELGAPFLQAFGQPAFPFPIQSFPAVPLGSSAQALQASLYGGPYRVATYILDVPLGHALPTLEIGLAPGATGYFDVGAGCSSPLIATVGTAGVAFQRNALDPAPLLITSNPSHTAMAREPMRFAFTAMGLPRPTSWRISGELPAGFSLDESRSSEFGVALLSGTVAPGNGGREFYLTVSASNGVATSSQSFQLRIEKIFQDVYFEPVLELVAGTVAVPLRVQSNANLPVRFESNTPGVCAVSGNMLLPVSAGTCAVVAYVSGNEDFNPATISMSTVVLPVGTAVLSAIATPQPPLIPNRDVTFTTLVKMSAPTGNVSVTENGTDLPGCSRVSVEAIPGSGNMAVATCSTKFRPGSGPPAEYRVVYYYPPGRMTGRDTESIPISLTAERSNVSADAENNTGMWWAGADENGWGLSISQHGNTLFAVLYAYDGNGEPIWYAMPQSVYQGGHRYRGTAYLPTSAPFNVYDFRAFQAGIGVGFIDFTFTSRDTATLQYELNGVAGTKVLRRQIFAAESTAPRLIVGDIWYGGGREDGWGVNLAQQGNQLFPVWYTYKEGGRNKFFAAPGGNWVGNVFTADLYETTSSPWLGVAYDATKFRVRKVGDIRFEFESMHTARMTYSVDGLTQSKPIFRMAF